MTTSVVPETHAKAKAPAKRTRKTKAEAETAAPEATGTRALANRVAELMLERKADNVTILEVGGLTSFADYFVLSTAGSDRQVQAIARHLAETLKHEGNRALSVEGEQQSHWVLLDFGGVVAHLFYEPAREYYDLDGLWADAPRIAVTDHAAEAKATTRRRAATKRSAT